jgi:putative tryptophan/tyrosine transport system substrate-binding protein
MRRREFIAGLGSAAAWPSGAHGRQAKIPVIGYLDVGSASSRTSLTAFLQGLEECAAPLAAAGLSESAG